MSAAKKVMGSLASMGLWAVCVWPVAAQPALSPPSLTPTIPVPAPAPMPVPPPTAAPAAPAPAAPAPAAPAAADADKPVAVVNGEAITYTEMQAFMKQRPALPPNLSEPQRRQVLLEVVGLLIDDHLLQQYLRKNGPRVADAEINRWLEQLETGLKSQGHTLQEFYKERGLNEGQVRSSVSHMLQWVGFVNSQLSDDELKRYFEDSHELFEQIRVRASHILIRVQPEAAPAERQAARAKLEAIRQEVITGKLDFADAARKHSQCPTGVSGGDLGFFPRKFAMDEAFARAAFALKPGEVSAVVDTAFGCHLIKVTDRTAGQNAVFEKVKEEVKDVAAEEIRLKLLSQQRKASRIEVLLDAPTLKTPGASGQ